MTRRTWLITLLALALGALGPLGPPDSPSAARAADVSQRLAVEPGGRLWIDLDLGLGLRPDRGTLEVSAHDQDEVHITTESSGWGGDSVHFELEPSARGVRLTGRVEGATSWMFGGPKVRVRAVVPRSWSVDLRTSAGAVRVEGVGGGVRASTGDGDVWARDCAGAGKLRTLSGQISVEDFAGDLELKTPDGTVEAARIEGDLDVRTTTGAVDVAEVAGTTRIRTVGGDVELAGAGGPSEVRTEAGALRATLVGSAGATLETTVGELEVSLAPDAALSLDARTAEGTIQLGPGIALEGDGVHELEGALHGGGAPLWLRSREGDIRLSRRTGDIR